ncbi:MAG: helix-turn-helix transcriptional regulator [Mycobacteriales bacterium]
MDIPGLLRAARHEQAVTQRVLAARAGIAAASLSRFESGAALPSLPMLERILLACGRDAHWTLVHRHADLDAELARLEALSLRDRLCSVELLTNDFVDQLGQIDVLIGGAWAAALHGLPHEHKHGRLWVSGDETSLEALAALLLRRLALLYVDGELSSPTTRASTLVRHPEAEWRLGWVGTFSTTVVGPGGSWPAEVRVDGEEGPLRVVVAADLGPDDGVRPDVLERWLARRLTDRAAAP